MTMKIFLDDLEVITKAKVGISSIRHKILDLAFRGKLLPQNPNDEPVSVLMQRIIADKMRLVKEKKIRKQKPLPMAEVDQESFNIPTTWTWANLGDIGYIFTGNSMSKVAKNDKYSKVADGRPYIMTPNVGYGCNIESYDTGFRVPIDDDGYRVARPNIPLICKEGGSAGRKVGFTNQEVCFGNKLMALETYSDYSPRFVFYFLQSQIFFNQFKENMTGIIGGISLGAFNSIAIPSPPIGEQYRIVEKLDALMEMVSRLEAVLDSCEEERVNLRDVALTTFADAENIEAAEKAWTLISEHMPELFSDPSDVSHLRQIILQLAVRGQLVPQDLSSEPAPMVTVKEVVRFLNGYAFKSTWYQTKGIRLVRNQNITPFGIDWSDVKYISEARARDLERFSLHSGDIVLSLDRPLISTGLKVSVISEMDLPCLLLQRVACPRPIDNRLLMNYFLIWLRSPSFVDTIEPGRSNGVPHISTRAIEKMKLRLPSLDEQHRISAKVSALMVLCDDLEDRLKSMKGEREALAVANYW